MDSRSALRDAQKSISTSGPGSLPCSSSWAELFFSTSWIWCDHSTTTDSTVWIRLCSYGSPLQVNGITNDQQLCTACKAAYNYTCHVYLQLGQQSPPEMEEVVECDLWPDQRICTHLPWILPCFWRRHPKPLVASGPGWLSWLSLVGRPRGRGRNGCSVWSLQQF